MTRTSALPVAAHRHSLAILDVANRWCDRKLEIAAILAVHEPVGDPLPGRLEAVVTKTRDRHQAWKALRMHADRLTVTDRCRTINAQRSVTGRPELNPHRVALHLYRAMIAPVWPPDDDVFGQLTAPWQHLEPLVERASTLPDPAVATLEALSAEWDGGPAGLLSVVELLDRDEVCTVT